MSQRRAAQRSHGPCTHEGTRRPDAVAVLARAHLLYTTTTSSSRPGSARSRALKQAGRLQPIPPARSAVRDSALLLAVGCRVAWVVVTLAGCSKDRSERLLFGARDLFYVFLLMVRGACWQGRAGP